MNDDELIERINTLTAQNIALMHMLAAVVRQTSADVMEEYAARCAIFMKVTEPNMDETAREMQREIFSKVARTVLGDRNGDLPE